MSLLVGVIFAVIVLAIMWPTDPGGLGSNGAIIGIVGFVIGAAGFELIRRIRQGNDSASAPQGKDSGK